MVWTAVSQVASPLSGITNVDSLIDQDHLTYNYELPLQDSITFTFNVSSNVAAPKDIALQPLNDAQQKAVVHALGYISEVTGISFNESQGTTTKDLVFAYYNAKPTNAGVDYFMYSESTDAFGSVNSLVLNDTIMLNSNNPEQVDPVPGTDGYATVLHEVGHALGLKHPFEGNPTLPKEYDNESFTVMSYTPAVGHPTQYGPVDRAALAWLYGGDGLRDTYGLTVNAQGAPVATPPADFGDPLGNQVAVVSDSFTATDMQPPPTTEVQPFAWLADGLTALNGAAFLPSAGTGFLNANQTLSPGVSTAYFVSASQQRESYGVFGQG